MALKDQNDAWEIFSLIPTAIRVPENYGRKDIGDLVELAESIDRFGLLSPILVHIDDEGEYVLRSGLRRLRACQTVLGWHVVPVLAVDHLPDVTGEAIQAFRDEHTQRKELTPSEGVVEPFSGMEEPSLRQAGVAAETMVMALDVAASAVNRDVPGADAVIDDDDLDTAESSALRALELVRGLRKARLQVVGGE